MISNSFESRPLHRQQLVQRLLALRFGRRRRIIWRTETMRSPSKNMCSVRHSPMPSAPNLRAVCASARRFGIGAHRHAAGRIGPFHDGENSPESSGSCIGDRAQHHLAGRAIDGDDVAGLERGSHRRRRSGLASMRSAPAPETQGLPMPRATTAAWLVMPPRAVRMPLAACMP
jgi:hypothetical protein